MHSVEVLMGVYLLSMIATTVAIALGYGAASEVLRYDSVAVFQRGELWRLFTYAFWNQPNIPFLLELTVYFFFGREIERFFGRTAFVYLYAILFAASPALGLLCIAFQNVALSGIPCGTGLFVAFATMAPAVTLFLGISAKWLAITFVGIRLLSATASHDWTQVVIEGGGACIAFLATRYFQGRWVIDALSVFKRNRFQVIQGGLKGKATRTPRSERQPELSETLLQKNAQSPALGDSTLHHPSEPHPSEQETDQELVDRILEKISASGMASLSTAERSLLESARERLLMRDASTRR